MSYETVLATEAEWYALDLAPELPPIAKANGGVFDTVATHVRRLSQAGAQLYLDHGPTRQARGSKPTARLEHEVVALVLWPAVGGGARAHVDGRAVEDAVDAVVKRVLGPAGDVGHGGRWFRIGPVSAEPTDPLDALRWTDAIAATGAGHTVAVRYTVTEMLDL